MFDSLEVFRTSISMAQHAGSRQAVIARNIANSDTPGYRAQEIAPFRDYVKTSAAVSQQATRASHLGGSMTSSGAMPEYSKNEPSPNGNSVSIELEMLASIEAQREHRRALTIYKHGLDVLRLAIGRR